MESTPFGVITPRSVHWCVDRQVHWQTESAHHGFLVSILPASFRGQIPMTLYSSGYIVFGLIVGCAFEKLVKIIPLFIIFYACMQSSGNLGPGNMEVSTSSPLLLCLRQLMAALGHYLCRILPHKYPRDMLWPQCSRRQGRCGNRDAVLPTHPDPPRQSIHVYHRRLLRLARSGTGLLLRRGQRQRPIGEGRRSVASVSGATRIWRCGHGGRQCCQQKRNRQHGTGEAGVLIDCICQSCEARDARKDVCFRLHPHMRCKRRVSYAASINYSTP